jgi:hypothetical protein
LVQRGSLALAQDLQMLDKMLRCNAQFPRVGNYVSDAMVEQDDVAWTTVG